MCIFASVTSHFAYCQLAYVLGQLAYVLGQLAYVPMLDVLIKKVVLKVVFDPFLVN